MGDLRIKSQTLAIKGPDMQAGIKNMHATEVQVKQPINNPVSSTLHGCCQTLPNSIKIHFKIPQKPICSWKNKRHFHPAYYCGCARFQVPEQIFQIQSLISLIRKEVDIRPEIRHAGDCVYFFPQQMVNQWLLASTLSSSYTYNAISWALNEAMGKVKMSLYTSKVIQFHNFKS